MKNEIVRSIEIKAPISKVWEALTDHQKFGEWFRAKIDGPFVEGQRSTGHMTYPGYEGYPWEAIIQKIEPQTYFALTWPSGADAGEDETEDNWTLVEFRLEEIPGGTRLTVRESGFDRVPSHRRAAAFRDNSEGWVIQTNNIREYVENN